MRAQSLTALAKGSVSITLLFFRYCENILQNPSNIYVTNSILFSAASNIIPLTCTEDVSAH
jgi:hypothetical protein